jgi:hypothetical protein
MGYIALPGERAFQRIRQGVGGIAKGSLYKFTLKFHLPGAAKGARAKDAGCTIAFRRVISHPRPSACQLSRTSPRLRIMASIICVPKPLRVGRAMILDNQMTPAQALQSQV